MTRERERERERALLGTTVHDEEVSADIADTVSPTADEDEDDGYQLSRKEVKKEESKDTKIIESTIDPNAWKVEVEKVAPLLKMRMDADNKEWRTHLEHTKELQENIESKVPMARDSLGKLSETISQAIEAIRGREKTINSQYKKEVTDYTEVQEQLQEVMKRFEERNREVPPHARACLPPRSTHMRSGSGAHSGTAS
jgi:estrogen-related receptor beta like 1